jgi:hypothetical protein
VLIRFLEGHVFATFEQIRDWSRLPKRRLETVLAALEGGGSVVVAKLPALGEGWARASDAELPSHPARSTVFMLHKGDPLVRSHASELRRKFGDHEVLEYLMIDGRLVGAVLGHWRFAPYDVEDIVLELPMKERGRVRQAVLDAVSAVYQPPRHHIRKYAGKGLRASGP